MFGFLIGLLMGVITLVSTVSAFFAGLILAIKINESDDESPEKRHYKKYPERRPAGEEMPIS